MNTNILDPHDPTCPCGYCAYVAAAKKPIVIFKRGTPIQISKEPWRAEIPDRVLALAAVVEAAGWVMGELDALRDDEQVSASSADALRGALAALENTA